jgi:hypothetical protein
MVSATEFASSTATGLGKYADMRCPNIGRLDSAEHDVISSLNLDANEDVLSIVREE